MNTVHSRCNAKFLFSSQRILVQEAVNAEILNYAIVCDNLWKTYSGKNGEKSKDAVQGLSIAIPRGQCFGMLGPNGAGKTSTINMVACLSSLILFFKGFHGLIIFF